MTLIDSGAARQAIWAAIGDAAPKLLESGPNVEERLAAAGAAALLGPLPHVRVCDLGRTRGEVALLAPGPALCRPADALVARLLAVAALRFDRVIVLPSSVDPDDDLTRDTLARSARIDVFVSDAVSASSLGSSGGVQRQLLPDLALFFDYAPYLRRGRGTLNAFREDSGRCWTAPLPPDNEDISATARSLPEWLHCIGTHETVKTDRAYVMIAAAMLGKRVEFLPDAAGRLEAIAQAWLADLAVDALPCAISPVDVRRHPARRAGRRPRVTAVVVTRNRPRLAARAIESVLQSRIPTPIVVIDDNSTPAATAALAGSCAGNALVRFERSPVGLGAAGGRNFGVELSDTDYVLFLDDDAELFPEAVGHMLTDLDTHPEAGTSTATVVDERGTIQHAGGEMWKTPGLVRFTLRGTGRASQDPERPSTGPTGWAPTTALLVRRTLLEAEPYDSQMSAYFEDNEWSWRVAQSHCATRFRHCNEAMAIHRPSRKLVHEQGFKGASSAVDWLCSLARFWARSGRILWPWSFSVARDLTAPDGKPDLARARLVFALAAEKGPDWMFAAWTSGQLSGLLKADQHR